MSNASNKQFVNFVGQQLARYADGEGDMAHDVLTRIQEVYIAYYGELPIDNWLDLG